MTFDIQAEAATVEGVVENIMKVEPMAAGILGAFVPGVSAAQSFFMLAEPYLELALKTIASSNGGNDLLAKLELLNHMTQGMPNSPILSSPSIVPTESIHVTEGA